jgi:LuxR family transcriptional regulator, maltose regulon positive regulatory protein
MTVRKERRQRGGAYWVVYRRQGTRLRKVYVGLSAALTQVRLDQIAAAFRQPDNPSP